MGNIKLLLNTMRKFTPEGQAKIFSALRKTNPDYEEINKLSMSLRGDVVQKGESSKDIIAKSLSYFMQNGAGECNIITQEKPDCTILQRKIYRIKILQKK